VYHIISLSYDDHAGNNNEIVMKLHSFSFISI